MPNNRPSSKGTLNFDATMHNTNTLVRLRFGDKAKNVFAPHWGGMKERHGLSAERIAAWAGDRLVAEVSGQPIPEAPAEW